MHAGSRLGWMMVVWLGCAGTDEGGCPVDRDAAIGGACADEALRCGETSRCDPCTSDLSDCLVIECRDGAWTQVDMPTECRG